MSSNNDSSLSPQLREELSRMIQQTIAATMRTLPETISETMRSLPLPAGHCTMRTMYAIRNCTIQSISWDF